MTKKIVSIFELTLIVMSSFAFAYFVSTDLPDFFEKQNSVIQYLSRPIIPVVSASNVLPSGCCKETVSGSTCQEMVLADKDLCKTELVGTDCNVVSECQRGCCYDSDSGICSLNAPKEKCVLNGGTWDPSATCNIPQCQVGCCILGDGAAMMTTRECTQTANDYKIEKVFKPLDNKGTCDAYSDPTDMGACLFKSDDYSNDMNCIFTTKSKCVNSGRTFVRDYLCTSKELNTTCEKTTKTSCIEGDDRVYFMDSCGNKANVYDSTRANDQNYWEKIILPKDSCSGSPETCGNCDYMTGSICTKYVSGLIPIKPALGDYVCKNLNCVNGKKHGESWCVSDVINISTVGSPVGTRNYVASCFEGEIRIEGCADFNQEICVENYDDSLKYSEASCIINDWRSCIYANDFNNYNSIEKKCNTLPQCVMFNDIPGNEKYKDLPGFKENIANDVQGKAGSVGSGLNKYVIQCMPRFTPGYQFWNTAMSNPLSGSKKQVSSTISYGGSKIETDQICGLATFKCVSHIETTTPLINPSPSDKENPECNWQAVSQSNQKVALMMEGLNEKCRMLGSCGVQYNTQGNLGGKEGFSVNRIYVDKKGKSHYNYTIAGYELPKEYLNKTLKSNQSSENMGQIETLSQLTIGGAAYLFDSMELASTSIISSSSGTNISQSVSEARGQMGGGEGVAISDKSDMGIVTGLSLLGASIAVNSIGGTAGVAVGSVFAIVAFAAAGAILGSYIGSMIAKSAGMSPGESTAIVGFAAGLGGMAGVGLAYIGGICALCPACCLIMAIIMAIYMIYSLFTGVDHEYYITSFECNAWEPPKIGTCEACNTDVRPCSENKCRSLGANCRYFVDNGEPGYCATMADIWSAKISPWNEKLTTGNKYINISSSGFRIVSNEQNSKEVAAWKPVRFGIITDEPAICKLDTNHSKKYEEMRYILASDKNYATGKVDGLHHWITLSPHVVLGESEVDLGATTPPLEEGENNYYIICQNFAGMVNGAPFIVQVKQKEGPDLTPADITRTVPLDKSYLAYGSINTTFWVYLDEPAECKYSVDYDYNFFEEMPNNMSCLTGKDQGFYGEWPCFTIINNISEDTKIYVKCRDQPELVETDLYKRNENRKSFEYEFSVCQTGLEITSVIPTGIVEVNSSQEINLEVRTAGCINEGEAECAYRMPYYGDTYSAFWNTGKTIHTQPLTNLGSGERTVDIQCSDSAGNGANASINFTVFYDNSAPGIIRVFEENEKIVLETTEEANCAININETKQCDFKIPASSNYITKHSITLSDNSKKQTLYIRCEDRKGNTPNGCTEIIKMVDLKRGK